MKITKKQRIVSEEEFDFVTNAVIEASDEELVEIEEESESDIEHDELQDYVRDLVDYCSEELKPFVQSFIWDGGKGEFYVTVIAENDDIRDYAIPVADLKMDIEKDTAYIVDTIKEDLEVIEDEESD
jgi:hypothetical protein